MNDVDRFRAGARRYFSEFGCRRAREITHQSWVLIAMSAYFQAQRLVAELNVASKDVLPFARGLKHSPRGAIGFDFAIASPDLDCRTWKSRTPNWNSGVDTNPQTLETLESVQILAEFKIAASTSTSTRALAMDLEKLRAVVMYLDCHQARNMPKCFLLVLDQDRRLKVEKAMAIVRPHWPEHIDFPEVLVGP